MCANCVAKQYRRLKRQDAVVQVVEWRNVEVRESCPVGESKLAKKVERREGWKVGTREPERKLHPPSKLGNPTNGRSRKHDKLHSPEPTWQFMLIKILFVWRLYIGTSQAFSRADA